MSYFVGSIDFFTGTVSPAYWASYPYLPFLALSKYLLILDHALMLVVTLSLPSLVYSLWKCLGATVIFNIPTWGVMV